MLLSFFYFILVSIFLYFPNFYFPFFSFFFLFSPFPSFFPFIACFFFSFFGRHYCDSHLACGYNKSQLTRVIHSVWLSTDFRQTGRRGGICGGHDTTTPLFHHKPSNRTQRFGAAPIHHQGVLAGHDWSAP